ncbi:hypothetical protein BVI2075_700011 [Burkholderia vietnamiensis]|nr:hypothetical protein BVI2075_700011 [Burkholderia vietnamiensis]
MHVRLVRAPCAPRFPLLKRRRTARTPSRLRRQHVEKIGRNGHRLRSIGSRFDEPGTGIRRRGFAVSRRRGGHEFRQSSADSGPVRAAAVQLQLFERPLWQRRQEAAHPVSFVGVLRDDASAAGLSVSSAGRERLYAARHSGGVAAYERSGAVGHAERPFQHHADTRVAAMAPVAEPCDRVGHRRRVRERFLQPREGERRGGLHVGAAGVLDSLQRAQRPRRRHRQPPAAQREERHDELSLGQWLCRRVRGRLELRPLEARRGGRVSEPVQRRQGQRRERGQSHADLRHRPVARLRREKLEHQPQLSAGRVCREYIEEQQRVAEHRHSAVARLRAQGLALTRASQAVRHLNEGNQYVSLLSYQLRLEPVRRSRH